MIEIITASHNEKVLAANLEKSDIIKKYPFRVAWDFTNIPKAYNQGNIPKTINIFVHHDVFLPMFFEKDLLTALKNAPADWAIMGLAGVKLEENRRKIVGHILDRGKVWGSPIKDFQEVDTLDELILITKGDIVFDEQFEHDFYGPDICMQAKQQGKMCYVFKGFCDHNSSRPFKGPGLRTESFYVSRERFKEKWKEYLPIACTTGIIE